MTETKVQFIPDGLVAYWDFDEGSGTVAKDKSGNGNDGTIHGATYVNGRYGKALSFNGEGDYVALPFCYGKDSISEITVCAWVKSSSTAKQIIVSFDRSEVWRLALKDDVDTGNVGWDTTDSTDYTHDLGTTVDYADGNWHFICGWYKAGASPDKKIFVDGKVIASATAHGGKNLGAGKERPCTYGFIGVGSEANSFDGKKGPTHWFNGIIDEVLIYNRALCDEEIKALYEINERLRSVKVKKTTFFSADTFEAVVDNSDFTFNNVFKPYQEFRVYLDNYKVFTGRIKTIEFEQTANKRLIRLSGQDYSDLLMKIHATEEYSNSTSPCTAEGCELSEIVKDLMQKYAQGKIGYTTFVETTNKRYATNAGDSIQFKQTPVWDIIKNFAQAAAFVAYVDEDKELHFEPRSATSSGITLSSTYSTEENTYEMNKFDKLIDGDKILTRVIVYGDSSVPIIKQADALALQEKYGIIEEIYQDNSITDPVWAKDIAVERVKLFSIERETYTAETKNFVYAKVGQLIRVINPDYGLDTEMVIHSIEYDIKRGKISTKFVLNSYPESYIDFIKKISEEIKRLKAQNTTTGTIDRIIQFYEEFSLTDSVDYSIFSHYPAGGFYVWGDDTADVGVGKGGATSPDTTFKWNFGQWE